VKNFRLDCPICYGPASIEEPFVIPRSNRSFSRLALLGALAAALALAACGRKGPLDAPPGAATADQATIDQPESGQSRNLISRSDSRRLPVVQGEDKPIPLDALLN
jgi:predicted small lipoprotein YifL